MRRDGFTCLGYFEDAIVNEKEVRWWLRGAIIDRHGSLKNYAKSKNVSPAWISKLLKTVHLPDTLLEEFGIERIVVYRLRESK
jgi:hypothetical protein